MMSKTLYRLLFSVVFLLLASCGGGGGSSSQPAPAPDPRAVPLAISSGNAQDVTAVGLNFSEAMLQLGQLAVDMVDFLQNADASPLVLNCSNGSVVDFDFIDNDQSGTPSSGDTLTVMFRDCFQQSINGAIVGTVVIEIDSLTENNGALESLSLQVDFTDAEIGEGPIVRLENSLQVNFSQSDIDETLTATPQTDRFVITVTDGSVSISETFIDFEVSRTLAFDTARYEFTTVGTVESEALSGTFDLATPAPLAGFFSTFPDEGSIQINGNAASTLNISANFVQNSGSANISLNDASDVLADWQAVFEGYIWWNDDVDDSYVVRLLDVNDFELLSSTLEEITSVQGGLASVREPFIFQFSREIDITSLPDSLTVRTFSPNAPDVQLTILAQGAILLLFPEEQLEQGAEYFFLDSSLDLQDQFGNNLTVFLNRFTTENNLSAIAEANQQFTFSGETVQLDGRASFSTTDTIAVYQWSQITGPTVVIDGVFDAQASFVLPAVTSPELFEFQLRVIDERGITDTDVVSVSVFPDSSDVTVLFFRGEEGDYISQGREFFFTSATAMFDVTRNFDQGVRVTVRGDSSWSLNFAAPGDVDLTVGSFEGATRFPFQAANEPGLSLSGDGRGCNQNFGRFDVLEVEYDGMGEVVRFAADFEQRCESMSAAPLFGSIRINSSLDIIE